MFLLSVRYANLRYSRPTVRETRQRVAVLTHLPTGRRWTFNSRRAGMQAQAAMAAAVSEGRMTILPVEPVDAEPVAA